MIRFSIIAATAVLMLCGAAQAQEMMKCDDATVEMVMKEVEGAPADKKEMAMSEFNMAKEKMQGGMTEDCVMHLEAASKAAMGK